MSWGRHCVTRDTTSLAGQTPVRPSVRPSVRLLLLLLLLLTYPEFGAISQPVSQSVDFSTTYSFCLAEWAVSSLVGWLIT